MACHASARGQNTSSSVHAVNVLRAGLQPDKNDLMTCRGHLFRLVSAQNNLPAGSTG